MVFNLVWLMLVKHNIIMCVCVFVFVYVLDQGYSVILTI